MNVRIKLLSLWLSGIIFGIFLVVADELQALAWNAEYNFPLIGQLHKYGGYDQLGAWDLAFVIIIASVFMAMIIYGKLTVEWELLKK